VRSDLRLLLELCDAFVAMQSGTNCLDSGLRHWDWLCGLLGPTPSENEVRKGNFARRFGLICDLCLHCDAFLSVLRGIDWSGCRSGTAAAVSMGWGMSLVQLDRAGAQLVR
jgi:hypothetical protein